MGALICYFGREGGRLFGGGRLLECGRLFEEIRYIGFSHRTKGSIFKPNCTTLVHFGGISDELGRAMVCILARLASRQDTHGENKRV